MKRLAGRGWVWVLPLAWAASPGSPDAAWSACPACVPLDDPSGPPHGGFALGLYPGGVNTPAAAHLALALEMAQDVVPRDATGAPDPAGLIGWISIGMSNTNQEFAVFERAEDLRAGRNPRLVAVDAAVGGQSAETIANPAAPYWSVVSSRVAAAGLDPDQVQVAWLKEADGAVPDTSFPNHALTLESHLYAVVRHLRDVYPNLRLCYLSSRIYGGYAASPERGEPLSYETGFSVRWLIEDQIGGNPALNADPDAGPVEAPVLLWGPYLWANGTTPRASDGLVWLLDDLENDHVHPSPSGELKVANLLANFLAGDTTAAAWRDASAGENSQVLTATADAYVDDAFPTANFGGAPVLGWRNPTVRSYVMFDLSGVAGDVFHAKFSLKVPPDPQIQGVSVVAVSNTAWVESTITAATAPPFDGAMLGTIPQGSRGTAVSLDVTDAVQAALDAEATRLTLGLRWLTGSAPMQTVGSRESIDPPRLALGMGAATSVESDVPRRLYIDMEPNPFRGEGRLSLAMEQPSSRVSITVFDVRGRLVRTIFEGAAPGGFVKARWDGADAQGRVVPEGIYFVRALAVQSPREATVTRKALFLGP